MVIEKGSREYFAAIIHRAAAAADRRIQTDDGRSTFLTEAALLDILVALGLVVISDP